MSPSNLLNAIWVRGLQMASLCYLPKNAYRCRGAGCSLPVFPQFPRYGATPAAKQFPNGAETGSPLSSDLQPLCQS